MGFLSVLGTPLGFVMKWIFDFIGSYGWALVIFIILTRVIQFPLGIKQQKSTAKMANVQKKLKQIQKQFAKDKTRLNSETMKLYEQEGVSPTGGCLPMIVTFILLFGIIDVVYNPLKHLLGISAETLTAATGLLGSASSAAQLDIITQIQGGSTLFNSVFSPDQLSQIKGFDMTFLGANLGTIPNQVWGWAIIIPVVAFLTQIGSTIISMKIQEKNGQTMQGMMKWTMLLMPVMSLFFAFTMPIGVGVYWIISNVLMMGQSILLQMMYPPSKMVAQNDKSSQRAREKMKKKREQMEMYTKMRENDVSPTMAAVQVKEANKTKEEKAQEKAEYTNKLTEARKRMADKYGDE